MILHPTIPTWLHALAIGLLIAYVLAVVVVVRAIGNEAVAVHPPLPSTILHPPSSALRIPLTWDCPPGACYVVVASTNPAGPWQLATNVPLPSSRVLMPMPACREFWRVYVALPMTNGWFACERLTDLALPRQ
jgi:hypothetical protein